MATGTETVCPKCGGELKHYDTVKRIVRTKGGQVKRVKVRRAYCHYCGEIHRQLPEFLIPFKQYEAGIIFGVLEELITPETLGFEDYPCEMTMVRWLSQKQQLLLWKGGVCYEN